ncbi:MAG TPA: tetratricopeptide repeat protein [Syntrophobacter fumaroxidans]|nr:tetratricopeptide repeat protein [Syntrophobacter fumaroxidans]
MGSRKRGKYSFNLDESVVRNRSVKKGGGIGRWIVLFVLLAVLAGSVYSLVITGSADDLASYLPFPKKLVALRFQHNGQEVLLLPDSQVVLNPRDSLRLLEIQTDGWVSWGTKVASPEMNVKAISNKPAVIQDLFPQESFEKPKAIEIRVLLWNRFIGKVNFLVQLDARDWVQKANATSDLDRKIFFLEKALQENAGNVLVKTQLAGLYFEDKKYDEAGRLYREIDASGKSKSISERLLLVYQIQNKVDDALLVYLDLFKLSEEPETFKEFLQYVQKKKSKEDAARFLEKHQQHIPKAFQSSLMLFLADLNTQTKNWAKAATSYEKAIKAGIKDPDVLYNLAVTYQQSDDPDKAIQALEKYLQKNPGDTKSWLQLGELLEKKGALTQARSTYEAMLQKNPQNREALVRLVAILEKGKDKGALQAAYQKLAATQPRNKTIQHNLGVLYYDARKYDKAAACFETVAALDPKDVESRKYLLDIYRKQKNDKAATAVIQSLAQLDPKNTSYYDTIFKSYEQKKDYKGMAAFFRTASQQHPEMVALHNYALFAALKTGDNKGAIKELDHLNRLQPKEKKHLRQAANLCESSRDYAGALKRLESLLKLDPKDKEAKEDYLRIKMLMVTKKKPE